MTADLLVAEPPSRSRSLPGRALAIAEFRDADLDDPVYSPETYSDCGRTVRRKALRIIDLREEELE